MFKHFMTKISTKSKSVSLNIAKMNVYDKVGIGLWEFVYVQVPY